MDEFVSRHGGHEAASRVPPRAISASTESSTSESHSHSTTRTSPFLNTEQPLSFPDLYSKAGSSAMYPGEDQNAIASTSRQRIPSYYQNSPPAEYQEDDYDYDPTSQPHSAPVFSQSPSPIPVPAPMSDFPVGPHDSGVDFGPGVRPASRASSRRSNQEPPASSDNNVLIRSRSLMGFAKTQSRLGFIKPRPPNESNLDSDSDDLGLDLVAPHFHTYEASTQALVEELRPVIESCIEIVVRLIPSAPPVSTGRFMRLQMGREEEASASMEGTLRHLWSCITLRPGCACPNEEEQYALPEGERGSDICREFHEAFERKLRRFTTRMKTFHDQINRPRRMHSTTFTERLLGWQDAFDQWINRFERLNAYLRLRLAHAHAKQLHSQLELERTPEDGESGSGASANGRHHYPRRTLAVQQLKADYDAAKSALLDAHKRAAGLAWRRDGGGQLMREFGTWAIRE